MYDQVLTPGPTPAQIDLTATRGTALLGVRVTPVLQDGQTYAEAMAGLELKYFFDGNFSQGQAGANPKFQGEVILNVADGSARKLVNASNLIFETWLSGQTYIVSILEYPGEDFYPDDAGAFASGGGSNPALVTTTIQIRATGYAPVVSPTDGASIQGATGLRLYFNPEGGTWVDGQPILAYRFELGAAWVRCPLNDQAVPEGMNALGPSVLFGLPDMQLLVGTPNERIMFVPAVGAISGGSGNFTEIYEVQQ